MRLCEYFNVGKAPLNPMWNGQSNPLLESRLVGVPDNIKKIVLNTGLGVEIEVENARELNIEGWECKKDGSLRDKGYEFVTNYGARIHHFPELMVKYHQLMPEWMPKRSFSERCSVHIHLDVRRLDEGQLKNFLVIYTLVEEALFKLAGPLRRHNVFCVPIRESVGQSYSNLWYYMKHASKYTAMNVLCAHDFGTFEFRHMEGTDDPEKLATWIVLLGLIKAAAQTMDHKELIKAINRLKNDSAYESFLRQVFYKACNLLPWEGLDNDDAVSDSKFFFFTGKDVS